ncbi:MAG: lipocalin-like domain-containing protein [Patescibacteria group bacterium]|nr:lipocalin-like domain-containing protein [Patescibacteria group bacterium]
MPQYKEKFKPLKFPKDEQKHDHIIEWWYFNGNLKTKDGRSFSYMNTIFATKPKLVHIPFLSKIPVKTLYFSHYLLTDNDRHKFVEKINPICLVDPNSFTKPLLWINYDNTCLIEEPKLFNYHVVNELIDLNLKQTKKPLLVNKRGFMDLEVKTTYYYSLTNLKTKGMVKIGNTWQEVEGLSWMDHQWAQTPLTGDDKWTWFSVQLANGLDILIFVYGDKVRTYHASMIDRKNKILTSNDILIKEKGKKFISTQTGAAYNLEYEIYLPDFGIELQTKPYNRSQEMVFGTLNYWEGGVDVKAKMNGKEISGQGFMELVGSPMKKSLTNVYLNRFKKDYLNKGLRLLSKEFLEKFRAYQ